jgi:hypothetical protein
MNRVQLTTLVVALSLAVLAASCKQTAEEHRTGPIQSPTVTAGFGAGQLGQSAPGESVWPPPADATRSSQTVLSKQIVAGTGKETPELNENNVLAIGYAVYDQAGRVTKHVPLMVQAIDLAPKNWRDVLLQMRRGEVRRAWITMPNHTTTIMDFEIRSISRITPDGTAVNVD